MVALSLLFAAVGGLYSLEAVTGCLSRSQGWGLNAFWAAMSFALSALYGLS